ncbi:hypothetical protein MK632_17030 [Rhizobium changzhiense]|uniref:hypothetical protein n=1 Tax=Rhizobium changzhiense TaxID=2692317 RepID=UPI001F0B85DC|nr:hypothetical protein [Rhizobium changzhiense]MCH4547452.1 hypothetical protein [Rhizobium changzhiense]
MIDNGLNLRAILFDIPDATLDLHLEDRMHRDIVSELCLQRVGVIENRTIAGYGTFPFRSMTESKRNPDERMDTFMNALRIAF